MCDELMPYWFEGADRTGFPRLNHEIEADCVVVGAGITGLTTAYLLAVAGKKVVVLEAGRVARGESGHTTAHITHLTDVPLDELVSAFGHDTAKAVWDGLLKAMRLIEKICDDERIVCALAQVPGYLVSYEDDASLEAIAQHALAIGHEAMLARPGDWPFRAAEAVHVPQQIRMHPVRYLLGLVQALLVRDVEIYENTHVVDVHALKPEGEGSARAAVQTESGSQVRCKDVVVAAHTPFHHRFSIHTKQAAYRTYVLGMRIPKGRFPDILLMDTDQPYHYVRIEPGVHDDLILIGGEDHKTGQPRGEPFAALEEFARERLGLTGEVLYRWSGQINKTVDGLPFIGHIAGEEHVWLATGYGGDGMTYGTLAASILSERILGRSTIWDEMFTPGRISLHGIRDFLAENKDYPTYLVRDWLAGGELRRTPADLAPGEGGVFRFGARRAAVSRFEDGRLVAVSPVCTHLGCHVHYNGLEKTWDCPCHGSRFGRDGSVLNGPAVKGLEPINLVHESLQEDQLMAPSVLGAEPVP